MLNINNQCQQQQKLMKQFVIFQQLIKSSQVLLEYQKQTMNEQNSRQKEKRHQKLVERIKKQINTQDINFTRISYSFLEKKNKSGIGHNTRLFILYHKDKIGYISKLQKTDFLPFQSLNKIPNLKDSIKLDMIQKIKSQKQVLKIPFKKGDKIQTWQFNCDSQDLAKNWVKIIKANQKQSKNDQSNPKRDVIVDDQSSPQKKQKSEEQIKEKSQKSIPQKPAQNTVQNTVQNNQRNVESIQKQRFIQNTPQQVRKQGQQEFQRPNTTSIKQKQLHFLQEAQTKQLKIAEKQQNKSNKSQQQLKEPKELKEPSNNETNNVPIFGLIKGQQKLQATKPASTLYVGGVSVNNQKDQTMLKNKMQSFESITSKIKQEYQRKKLQQRRIQQQMNNQTSNINPTSNANLNQNLINIMSNMKGSNLNTPNKNNDNILGSLMSFSTNIKFQIQRMQRQWGYQFANSSNQYQVVEKFKFYVQTVSTRIIQELGLQEKKRYYQPSDSTNASLHYEINGVSFDIFLAQLKEANSNAYIYSQNGTIISVAEQKIASHQFKNYDYILRLTHNKGKIRVPLSMLTYYKGFAVYAKVIIPIAENYENMDILQKQLQILEAQSKISNTIFQDPQPRSGRIVALQSKVYEKLARAQNSNKKFDLCYVQGLKYYLPQDFNSFNKQKPYQRLRWQLLQDQEWQQKILYGQDMCAVTSRLKMPQNLRDGINQLTQISKLIFDKIDIVVQLLESTQQYFTNSQQLSQILHKNGINIRYLGGVLQKLKQNWLKQIIMSEICARCAKKYLSFDLQDCTLNLNQTNLQNVHKFQDKQLIKFLNKMLGNTHQTQIFWKQLNRQSQSQYKVSINRQELNQQYLLQALQYHCCFKLKDITGNDLENNKDKQILTSSLSKKASTLVGGMNLGNVNNNKSINHNIELFTSSTPFSQQNLAGFQHKSKVYNLQFTQLYSSISSLINQPSVQSFQQIKILLNLSRNQFIPTHFRMSQMYQNIILFLINWVSPKQMNSIYYPEQLLIGEILPSRLLYTLRLAEIRWALKQGRTQQSQQIKDWIVEHVNRWIGQCHPLLTQLYQIYVNYYMMFKDQEKKAVNYSKTAIRNQQRLIGANHQKMADSYYLLGTVYMNYNKKLQAINCLKKSKQIISKGNNSQSEAYGEVCLKMGQLYLAVNQIKQSLQCALQSMDILQKCENQSSLIIAIQLVCRCYELQQDWQSYLTLIQNSLAHKLIEYVDDLQLLQRLIKVCLLPSLRIISDGNLPIGQKILKIVSELPQTTRAPNMAYNFLRVRIQQKIFPYKFLEALSDIEQILMQIESNGMLARWKGFENLTNKSLLNKVGVNIDNKGFNFIATLEAVNIFIGSSFIQGVLLDQ